ncbi:kinesin-like protein KIF3B [Caerostris darwini]|uniref:Kinesin-like protein n=1 Tax=Caerostris darwini TaxID=1538125 RepID=A0AAV4SNF0_9ARAC|nr:kinesin-like protein KIF3B [Caerostris darwini]
MSEKETTASYHKVVKLYPDRGGVEVQIKTQNSKYFTFDAVYDGGNQADIYDEVFRPLVDSVISGFNGTVIAYGQTGAGKTWTMEGQLGDSEHEGVIPNSFRHIFNHIARSQNTQFLVSASYIEIYQEEVRDLLSSEPKRKLEVRERNDTGVYVKDLSVNVCKTVQDLEKVMIDGKLNRSIGTTNMNAHSSRSHAIFMITIESCETDADGNTHMKMGKLNLVDLAGSEKQAKTGAVGSTQKESIKINLSLSALGNVISALVDGKSTHVPYRDSKLTRLLQDSLGGNAKTIMIANIGPASFNLEETITTLRYANRAKNIKNKPVVNVDPKDAILLQFKQEISMLKAQLALKEAKRKKKKETTKITDETIEDELDASSVEIVQKMENLLQEERVAYLNEQNLMTEEKEKIMRDIKAKDEELRLENEAKEKIRKHINELEAKLLCGGKNIIDHTNEQQRILEKRRQELAEQKCIEREMQAKLLEEEESTLEKKETYDSLQQEVDMKTKKLKKLFQRFQTLKDDINDESEINSFERQDKEQTIEALTRDLKLSNLVIDNFVNPEDKAKFLEHVKYDEDEDAYVIFPSEMSYSHFNPAERPASANHLRRPMTGHAMKMNRLHSSKPRYKCENIVVVDFAIPRKRTIEHYEPEMDPYAREAIKNMLADQIINVQFLRQNAEKSPEPVQRTLGRFGARTSSHCGRQLKSKVDLEQYPVPRGLVPK